MTSAGDAILTANPRARWLLPVMLIVLVAISIWRLAPTDAVAIDARLSGSTMGTTWSVRLAADVPRARREELARALQARLDEIDGLMSTWKQDSELSRFNAAGSTEPFPASPALLEVFRIARETSETTGGAFDVTVAPVVAAWGFGATDRIPAPPPSAELAELRGRTGFEQIEIDEPGGTLRKRAPRVTADLSAVAKGWAVDQLGELLRERGHASFLVEVGGELLARGERPEGGPWRVAIERPIPGASSIHAVVELADLALATSGDYRNYYEADGRWFSHLIDPRTAAPVQHALASVSVVHPSAARADALATALIVLGPEAGRELALREGLAAYFVVRDGELGLREFSTPAFPSPRAPEGAGAAPQAGAER